MLSASEWFLGGYAISPLAPSVFCFVHAGGNPERYLEWQPLVEGHANLIPICPPGVGRRYGELRYTELSAMADAVAAEIQKNSRTPFYLFGHSFGAVFAYEVAKRLTSKPVALIVSGCAAPSFIPSARVVRMARLTEEDFLGEAGFFGGIPSEVTSDLTSFRELLLPMKKDFELMSRYTPDTTMKLSVPVVTLLGDSDPHVAPEQMLDWQHVTTRTVEHNRMSGGHFYFDNDPQPFITVLKKVVGVHQRQCDKKTMII